MKKLQFWTSVAIIVLSCFLVLFATDRPNTSGTDNRQTQVTGVNLKK